MKQFSQSERQFVPQLAHPLTYPYNPMEEKTFISRLNLLLLLTHFTSLYSFPIPPSNSTTHTHSVTGAQIKPTCFSNCYAINYDAYALFPISATDIIVDAMNHSLELVPA